MVRHAVIAGLLSTGNRIVDIGVCPTPTVQLGVRHARGARRHRDHRQSQPAEWNALKFIGPDALFLNGARGRELLDIYHQGEYRRVAGGDMREIQHRPDVIDLHARAVLDARRRAATAPRSAAARGARFLQRRRFGSSRRR